MLAFAIVLANCGNDSHPLTTATNQFAFIRYEPILGGTMSAAQRHVQMEHRQAFQKSTKPRQNSGLKPWVVEIPSGPYSVVLMNNDGTGERVIANQAGYFESVQQSYDGKKGVAVAEDSGGYYQVFYVDLADLNNPIITQLTTDTEDHWGAQISQDGKKVVFTKWVESANTWQLVTMSTSGGTETVIPTSFEANYPTFAPNGKIVFENDDTDTISIMNADGSGLADITSEQDTEHGDWAPSVSPDGNTVVLSRNGDIYKVSVNGGTLTQLTTDGESWDPMYVNNKIVYISYPANGSSDDVFSMNVDGTNQKPLTTNSVYEFFEGGD